MKLEGAKLALDSQEYEDALLAETLEYEPMPSYKWERQKKGPTITSAARLRNYRERKKDQGVPLKPRKFDAPFISWDGEGHTTEDGTHLYTLLANSRGDYLHRPEGIVTIDAFDFLLDCAQKYKFVNHVGFAIGYDINMILKDLTEDQLRRLNEAEEVTLRANGHYYWVGYRHRKYLTVCRSLSDALFIPAPRKKGSEAKTRWIRNTGPAIKIYDTFGFFQRSFVGALKEYFERDHLLLLPDLPTIERMKRSRGKSEWATQTFDDVLHYCVLECKYLSKLMSRLRGYLRDCDLIISAWDGTGAIARYVLSKYRIKRYMKPTAPEMQDIIRRTYSGGRIEAVMIGHAEGSFYDYDINSAYPAIMETLPCMACSSWRKVPKGSQPSSPWYVSRIRAQFETSQTRSLSWFPLWQRMVNGEIRYSRTANGWYWGQEARAAFDFFTRSGGESLKGHGVYFNCTETWELVTPCEHKPFAFIRELYDLRLKMIAENNPAQQCLKLAINSCYGKILQQIGGTEDKLPPFFQLEWAALITAGTRAKLVDAAMTLRDWDDVIFFATDGILTREPLNVALPEGKPLGAWALKDTYAECIIALAGMYWLRKGEKWIIASRGLERIHAEDPLAIVRLWQAGKDTITYTVPRFVTLRVALLSDTLSANWNRWLNVTREHRIDGTSAKRLPYAGHLTDLAHNLFHLPIRQGGDMQGDGSYPYSIHFWRTEPYPGKPDALATAFASDDDEDQEAS